MIKVQLPCGCSVDVETARFKTGQRGVVCPRHERTFVIAAVVPKDVTYNVVREETYKS